MLLDHFIKKSIRRYTGAWRALTLLRCQTIISPLCSLVRFHRPVKGA